MVRTQLYEEDFGTGRDDFRYQPCFSCSEPGKNSAGNKDCIGFSGEFFIGRLRFRLYFFYGICSRLHFADGICIRVYFADGICSGIRERMRSTIHR